MANYTFVELSLCVYHADRNPHHEGSDISYMLATINQYT